MQFIAVVLALWLAPSIAGLGLLPPHQRSLPPDLSLPPPDMRLLPPALGLPLQGLQFTDLHDTFNEVHNGHAHEAIDILAARGTPVHAVVSGTLRKLFLSKPGGNTIYEFDEAGEYCYYYAHLDHYAEGLREGMQVKRGDIIAYVGSTGNADSRSPHLHLAIFELGPEREWWKGQPRNPYPGLVEALRNLN